MTTDFYRHFTALIGDVDAPACRTTLRTDERYFARYWRGAIGRTRCVRIRIGRNYLFGNILPNWKHGCIIRTNVRQTEV